MIEQQELYGAPEKATERIMVCSFTVLGDPTSQKRHRHVNMGKFVRTYDPSADDKADFRIVAQQQAPPEPISDPMLVKIGVYFPRPKSHYGTGRNSDKLKPSAPAFHTKKPDSDNCAKFVFDALNGIFWTDDSYICGLDIMKHYSTRPRTEVQVFVLREVEA